MARRPGGPYRLRATSTALRCPTTSRPRRIQPERRSSRRRPLASSTAAARLRPRLEGSRTTRSVPARRASAASLPSRSPTRFPATAGSRPSGRSMTSRSTVRAVSSAPARASASSRSTGVRTTSHSRRTPRATASTASKARARSSHATIAPPACASAAVRSATVVLPEDADPRSVTVAARGNPPGPRMASSAANPVGTMWPSASMAGVPGRRVTRGARGVGARGSGSAAGSGAPAGAVTGSGIVIGARARAPSVASTRSPPRRGAAEPQRAWRAASASETSDAGAIGRPIIERLFYRQGPIAASGIRRPRVVTRPAARLGRGIDRIESQLIVTLRPTRRRVTPGPAATTGATEGPPSRATLSRRSTRSVGCGSRGDVAQLGERRVRIAEARGSSPSSPPFVGRLGRW